MSRLIQYGGVRQRGGVIVAHGAEGGAPAGSAQAPPGTPSTTGEDAYLDKLAKYVPAETITLATAFFAAFTLSSLGVWVAVAVGAVVNVVYLLVLAVRTDPQGADRPWYFYVLSAAAFLLWALATINAVADAAALDSAAQRAFILTFAAFIVPALDGALGALGKRAHRG